jgi:uncharacterized protein YndB with AHSA1/START domain
MPNYEILNVTTPTDREIVVTRVFNAPRNLVFDAWTNPQYLPHWMLGPDGWSMPVCEIDLRPGGSWHFVWRHASGQEMEMRGQYREVKPPERVVSSESWGPDWPENSQHRRLQGARRQDHRHDYASLPVQGSS